MALFASVVTSFASDGTHPGYLDNLVFSLGIRGQITPGDATTYTNVYDEMTAWSESPLVPVSVSTYNPSADATKHEMFGTPDPICVSNGVKVVSGAYPWVTNEASVLYFPSSRRTYTNGDGTVSTNCFPQTVTFGRSVPTGSNVTYRIRFRWDGNLPGVYEQRIFTNGMDANGGFGLRMYFGTSTVLYSELSAGDLRFYVGNGYVRFSSAGVNKGCWYDIVVRMTWSENCDGAGNPGTKIRYITCEDNQYVNGLRRTQTGELYIANKSCYTAESTALPLYLGHNNVYDFVSTWQEKVSSYFYTFRGAIAQLQIYDRAFSDAEMMALYEESDGATMSVGSENGSTDEFAAAADAAAVYEPLTMPMFRMQGVLTAANPSTTIKFPMHEESESLPMVLRLSAVPEGVGSAAAVALSINGGYVCSRLFNTAGACEFHIPARYMVRDGDGNVTITLARTGNMSGTLKIDALKLIGSWQLGKEDGGNTDWCFRDVAKTSDISPKYSRLVWGVVGWPYDTDTLFNTLHGLKNEGDVNYFSVQNMAFWISPELAATCPSSFTMHTWTRSAANVKADFYTNGCYCTTIEQDSIAKDFTIDFPPGALLGGLNQLTISNATENAGSSIMYAHIKPDFYRFKVKLPPPQSFVIMFR